MAKKKGPKPKGKARSSRSTKVRLGTKPKKTKAVKQSRHPKVRPTCRKCGRNHSTSSHRSHGIGSYARTH